MTLPGDQPNPWSREGQGQPYYPPAQYPAPQYPPPPPPPPPARRYRGLWVAVGVVVAIVLGAAIWGAVGESRSSDSSSSASSSGQATSGPRQSAVAAGDTKVVTASDRKSQLTVPATWKDMPKSYQNELATIQLGDLRKEQYVAVITASKGDFDDLAGFAEACLADADALEEANISQQRPLTVGGLTAVQHVITGKTSGIRIVFWYTMVEGKNNYFQVVGWTLPSKQSEAEPVILDVVNSFRELGAG
jgi:hypothetical protein